MFEKRFESQVAIVTGGASGIGEAVSQRFAKEGGKVVVWDRDPVALQQLQLRHPSVETTLVDLTDPAAVTEAARGVEKRHGRLDVLVCSAGITGPNRKTWEYSTEDWKRVFDINVNGVFYANKACVPMMIAGNYGRIVNIASIAGKEGNPNAPAYSASKAAVIGLTKSLGKELADRPIAVNCVTPAAVRTAIFDQMSEEHIAFMLSKIPMGRFGTVDEVTSLVLWLASAECSFSTGGVFDISGGRATY